MASDTLYYWTRKVSSETLLGRSLRLPLRVIPKDFIIRICSGPAKGIKWIVGSSHHGVWMGIYEVEVQNVFKDILKPGDIVYDVGSNVGFFTLLGSRLVGNEGIVVAFEPVPRNLEYLRKHAELNNCVNVRIEAVAVTSINGPQRMNLSSVPDPVTASLLASLEDTGELEVSAVTLDDIIERKNYPLPSFIKMDIEGAEYLALQGARKTIVASKPTILLSTHGDDVRKRCLELLDQLDYEWTELRTKNICRPDELVCIHKSKN